MAFLLTTATAFSQAAPPTDPHVQRPRVIILTDIGNEPDDQMSLIRLLLYSNQLDLEALIATTSTWQRTVTHPETIQTLVEAYGTVRAQLLQHAQGWPTAAKLSAGIASGQPAYGLLATGPGHGSPGSSAILRSIREAVLRHDPRPLWICLWGGSNTLAQALLDLRAQSTPTQLAAALATLRISSISDQDDAGPWIRREFPTLAWTGQPSSPNSNQYIYATWTGISGDLYYRNSAGAESSLVTNQWLDAHIRSQGPLGKLYPSYLFIMEGDTPSFLNLLDNGLDAYRRPDWGGWGGRYLFLEPYGESHAFWTQGGDAFGRVTSQDTVLGVDHQNHTSDQATIWRWRPAFQNDFAARIAWTTHDFAHANHNPVVVVNQTSGTEALILSLPVGHRLTLDATGTHDPDPGQTLTYRWSLYPEAGASDGNLTDVELTGETTLQPTVRALSPCRPLWLPLKPCKGPGTAHLILAVTDDGTPALTSYRRIILTVTP